MVTDQQRELARVERRAENAEFAREALLDRISDALIELGPVALDKPAHVNDAIRTLEAAIKGRLT